MQPLRFYKTQIQQPKLYKIQKNDIFTTTKNLKDNSHCKLIKTRKHIKWYNPITWFKKYYIYMFLG